MEPILDKLKEHDEQFSIITKKLEEHDTQFAAIDRKLNEIIAYTHPDGFLMIRKIPSVLAQSVSRILPSGAGIFNCSQNGNGWDNAVSRSFILAQ